MMIYDNEDQIRVNEGLDLIQNRDGLKFGSDALLLSAFIGQQKKDSLGIELGSGTGIISLLCLRRNQIGRIIALEVQEEFADLTRRNAVINRLDDRLMAVCSDIRNYEEHEIADLVFTNPPYMKTDSGKANRVEAKFIARHETAGDIYDFCLAGARLLKYGGKFFAVYRPDRLVDLLDAMRRSGIEPKVMQFVSQSPRLAPSLVLIEGKRGASGGLILKAPFTFKDDDGNDSKEYEILMQEGRI